MHFLICLSSTQEARSRNRTPRLCTVSSDVLASQFRQKNRLGPELVASQSQHRAHTEKNTHSLCR